MGFAQHEMNASRLTQKQPECKDAGGGGEFIRIGGCAKAQDSCGDTVGSPESQAPLLRSDLDGYINRSRQPWMGFINRLVASTAAVVIYRIAAGVGKSVHRCHRSDMPDAKYVQISSAGDSMPIALRIDMI